MASPHPEFEDLLLWQSRELDADEDVRIAEHLKSCLPCQEELAGIESLKDRVVSVNTMAAQRSFHVAVERRRKYSWQWAYAFLATPRTGTAAVASVLIVVLVVLSLTQFTPAARAETLLNHAIKEQQADSDGEYFLRVEAANLQCKLGVEVHTVTVRAAVLRNQETCHALTEKFQAAGWTKSDLLSANSFQQWRKGLHRKEDSIRKLNDAVEVTTSTGEGVIRTATLRLRSSDYRPVYGKFEFASDVHEAAVEVTEAAADVPESTIATASTIPNPDNPLHAIAVPSRPVDPLDIAEAQTRLALHDAGVDRSVLVAVEREKAKIKVWGVVPSEQVRYQLAEALKDQRDVILSLQTENSQEPGPLPWQAYRGDSPALALDTLQTLFPSDIEARQKLLNEVDKASRQVVAESRSRDALLYLTQRIQPADAELADQLRRAAASLEVSMLSDLSSLRDHLHPVLGTTGRGGRSLNESQAMRLYVRVHEVLFQARSGDPLDFDSASSEIRSLLG